MKLSSTVIGLFIFCQCCFAQHWQSLRDGVNNWPIPTFMFADTISNQLYVGGRFKLADNDPARGIASWDGSDWAPLGDGIDSFPTGPSQPNNIWGMVHFGNYLYVGGNFVWAGEVGAKFLARWDGTTWDTIPGGQPNGAVADIKVYNGDLYISGTFDSIGSVAAGGIARWDGAAWQPIGTYPFTSSGGRIWKMEFYHGNLYVGGMFSEPSGWTCRLARWDGTTWQFMTNDLTGGIADVWDFAVFNDELYVSGLFFAGAGNAGNSIMRWNDTTWRDVGGSVGFYMNSNPQVRQMLVHNGKLFCAGNFETIGGIMAFGLASWDGVNWCGYNTSFVMGGQEVGTYNLEFYHDTLYMSGNFRIVEGDSMNGIAKWIGGSFVDTCGNTTSILDHSIFPFEISVFPNPAAEIVKFQFSTNQQSHEVVIYDTFGKEIWREETDETTVAISVDQFAEGIYFYSIIEDGEIKANGKFVVVH